MKNNIQQSIQQAKLFLIFTGKLLNSTDFISLFNTLKEAKELFFTDVPSNLDSLIIQQESLQLSTEVDDKKEILFDTANKFSSNGQAQANTKLYTVLKITDLVIGSAATVIGLFYCIHKFGSNVDLIADTAQKGLDESAKVASEATKTSLDILDQNKEILETKQDEIIKNLPKIKSKHYYIPPKR